MSEWPWMTQIGRNVTTGLDGIFQGKRYLTQDRDPLFTAEFLDLLGGESSLRNAVKELVTHYLRERNHQGLEMG